MDPRGRSCGVEEPSNQGEGQVADEDGEEAVCQVPVPRLDPVEVGSIREEVETEEVHLVHRPPAVDDAVDTDGGRETGDADESSQDDGVTKFVVGMAPGEWGKRANKSYLQRRLRKLTFNTGLARHQIHEKQFLREFCACCWW